MDAITVDAGELAAAVKYASRWIPGRPAAPVNGGMLFRAGQGWLDLYALNDTATGRASVPLEALSEDAAGSFVVSGRLIAGVAATLGGGSVVIEPGAAEVRMTNGRFWTTLPLMTEDDYPSVGAGHPLVGEFSGHALADAIRRVAPAASRNEKQPPAYFGVHVSFGTDGTATLGATDGTRFASQVIEWTSWTEQDGYGSAPVDPVLLPASALLEAADSFATAQVVEMGMTGGVVELRTPERSLTMVMPAEVSKFPAGALPALWAYERPLAVTFRAKDMVLPLRRVDQLKHHETEAVTLTVSAGSIAVSASGGEAAGSGADMLDAEYDGEPFEVILKSPNLHTALATARGENITIALGPETRKGALITDDADSTWRHLIVPLRPIGGSK